MKMPWIRFKSGQFFFFICIYEYISFLVYWTSTEGLPRQITPTFPAELVRLLIFSPTYAKYPWAQQENKKSVSSGLVLIKIDLNEQVWPEKCHMCTVMYHVCTITGTEVTTKSRDLLWFTNYHILGSYQAAISSSQIRTSQTHILGRLDTFFFTHRPIFKLWMSGDSSSMFTAWLLDLERPSRARHATYSNIATSSNIATRRPQQSNYKTVTLRDVMRHTCSRTCSPWVIKGSGEVGRHHQLFHVGSCRIISVSYSFQGRGISGNIGRRSGAFGRRRIDLGATSLPSNNLSIKNLSDMRHTLGPTPAKHHHDFSRVVRPLATRWCHWRSKVFPRCGLTEIWCASSSPWMS